MAFKCVPESSVRRLVECPICFDTFTNPKELDCQHTFCEKPCLDKLVNSKTNTLKCPLCRVVHNIPKGGIRELKTNKTIVDLVDITATSNTAVASKTECEVCFSKDYTNGCLHCSKMVCAVCKTRHTEHMLLDVQQLALIVLEATKSSLAQVEAAKSDLENDVTTWKSKVRETIDELVRHIQQRGRDIEHELDHHLATELSKITVVDDMCLKLNEVIGICHEIQKNMTSPTAQVMIEVKRKLLVEQYKAITAKFSMPSVSKIDVQLTTESICDSIHQLGTIIQVKNNLTQSSVNDLQSSQPNMNMICGAPGTNDVIQPRSAFQVTAPTIEMAPVSSDTNDVSHQNNPTRGTRPVHPVILVSSDSTTITRPRNTIQGTASVVEVGSVSSDLIEVTHSRNTIQGTAPAVEVGSASSEIIEVTHPRNTIQGTASAVEVGSASSEMIEVTQPRNTVQGTAPAVEVGSASSEIIEVTHPRNTIQGTAPVVEVGSVSSDVIEVTHPRNTIQGTTPEVSAASSTINITHPRKTIRGTANHQFRYIASVAISPVTGDVAVCDMGRHVIAVFTESGKYKAEFGGIGRRPGLFNTPRGVTYNKSGHIIVADSLNNRIQIFDDEYNLIMFFSHKGSGGYEVRGPRDVAASKSNIWVCDYGNNRIRIFTKDGRTSTGNNITSWSFTNPTRILLDHLHGIISILDSNGLHYFEPRDQDESTFINATAYFIEHRGITKDSAIAFNEDGVLIYTDKSSRIFVFDRNDTFVKSFVSREAEATNSTVNALAIQNGRIVVAGSKFVEIY